MFAYALFIGVVATVAHAVAGGGCEDLGGVWRNALGSNMSVVTSPDTPHVIGGHYSTAVESKPGAAAFSSPIAGVVKVVEGGSLVSWNVLWSGGKSMTTWVGQCIECDGRAVIFTTWALRSLQKPKDKWMTTRVNQDTFWRLDGADLPSLPVPTSEGANSAVLGRWTSISGDVLNITFAAKTGKLEGDHLTPVKEGNVEPVALFGATDGRHNYTALGFSAAGPTAVRGWTGHIYNPQEGAHPVLETSWLAHSFSDSCSDPRRFVSYGMDNYTQPISGPPEPIQNCSVTTPTSTSLLVQCEAGDDGGLPQTFHLEVHSMAAEQLLLNLTTADGPAFAAERLPASSAYVLVLYASNPKGRSSSVALTARTL